MADEQVQAPPPPAAPAAPAAPADLDSALWAEEAALETKFSQTVEKAPEAGGGEAPPADPPPPADGGQEQEAAGGQGEPEPPLAKGRKFAQSVREKARQNREMLARQAELEREAQELRAYRERSEKDRELEAQDPVAYWRSKGKSADEIARILMNAAKVETPEDVARQALEEAKSLKEKLRDEIRDELRQELSQQEKQRRASETWSAFMNTTASDEARFPMLAQQPEPVVNWLFHQTVLNVKAQKGDPESYTDEEYAEAMEGWLRKNARKRAAKPASGADGLNGVLKSNGTADGGGKKPAPRTATSDLGSRRNAKPANFDSLSLEEQDEWINKNYG